MLIYQGGKCIDLLFDLAHNHLCTWGVVVFCFWGDQLSFLNDFELL